MQLIVNILTFLQTTMEVPEAWGWYHWAWIILTAFCIVGLYQRKHLHSERQLKVVLGVYGVTALVLEVIKQIIWTFTYNTEMGMIVSDYQWYAAPFQLCTTPIYVCVACLFLSNTKLRKALLSYLSFFTILGGIATILMPDSCFTSMVEVNIHTMWLHCGSFVVSIYLLMSGEFGLTKENLRNAFVVFLSFVFMATILNVVVYHSGVLNGETFNMFYISPYFISSLPVFNVIQQNVPYLLFLLIYIFALSLGAGIVYSLSQVVQYANKTIYSCNS